jgi:signal transduction histidine kinase
VSFCGHAILQDQLFEVEDTLTDDRFFDNPLVIEDPSIRFYAGYPLITNTGSRLGTLCVIDRVPRKLTDDQIFALKVLSQNVIKIAELRQKNKHLSHLTETHKKMTAILAHDVRSPMVSVKGIIDYKKAGLFGEQEAEEMMDIALDQLSNTLQMVDDVVDWGQSELKYYDVQKEVINLRDVVNVVFGYEALKSRLKNNNLVNNLEDIQLLTDKNAITFIIRNLVSNANKYTENGKISVSAYKTPNHIEIFIQDSGAGMSKEVSSRLFTNATVSTTGTKNEKGNGLGLLLVNEYIHKLNGSISVDSQIGCGTRFVIKLTEVEL